MTQRTVSLRHGLFEVELREAGSGPRLLYLHGIWDGPDNALASALAERFAVLAPRLPGFGGSTGEQHLRDVHDAIYYFLDLLDALGFERGPLVGHCLGGMFAAELAAVQPARFSHLVLLAPFGLWTDEHPVPDFFAAAPADVEVAVNGRVAQPVAPGATAEADQSEEARIARALERAKTRAGAARFLWPIPDRGLRKRLHRVAAPTLLVWGSEDGIVPPSYGPEFQRLIRGARLEVVEGAAHLPHVQQPARVADLVTSFLGTVR